MQNTIITPEIVQFFDKDLLSKYSFKKTELAIRRYQRICELAKYKLREKNTGKIKEFNKFKELWKEYYERAEIKEKEYEEALENAKQMPRIPTTGGIVRFKRFQSQESI